MDSLPCHDGAMKSPDKGKLSSRESGRSLVWLPRLSWAFPVQSEPTQLPLKSSEWLQHHSQPNLSVTPRWSYTLSNHTVTPRPCTQAPPTLLLGIVTVGLDSHLFKPTWPQLLTTRLLLSMSFTSVLPEPMSPNLGLRARLPSQNAHCPWCGSFTDRS